MGHTKVIKKNLWKLNKGLCVVIFTFRFQKYLFICEYLFELNDFRRYDDGSHTIKDDFFYDSNINVYSYKDYVLPVSKIVNIEEKPSDEIIRKCINNNIPLLKRVLDFSTKTESWFFNTSIIKEMQNAN